MRDLYKRSSLSAIARAAGNLPLNRHGDHDFARYQIEIIEGMFPGVRFDFFCVATTAVDDRSQPLGYDCVLWKLDPSIVDSYANVAAYDELSPTVHLNPGRSITPAAIMPATSWQSSPFFFNHCRVYDIHKILRVGFQFPAMERKMVSFDYLGAPENGTWGKLNPQQIEMATFPFALAWLLRKSVIDDARLSTYLDRLSDLTPTQIMYLRKFVNSPWQDLSTQASELGFSAGGYKQTLYSIRDTILDRLILTDRIPDRIRSKSLRIVDYKYDFMRMMGDPSQPILRAKTV